LLWVAVGLAVALAAGVRLYGIDAPPLGFHPARQYHSAQLARAHYIESQESAPEWRKRVAQRNADEAGIVGEPPVMEFAASLVWQITGGERLWIPRAFSVLFWFAGGVLLFLIARRLASLGAALCSVGFYLFVPFSISASRSFQPDPMMVALLLAAVLAILRYREVSTHGRFWAAAAISALAVLTKPGIALFAIICAFLALSVFDRGLSGAVKDWHTYAFGFVAVLPSVAYVVVGTTLASFLEGDTEGRILPQLLDDAAYWDGWLEMIGRVVGVTPLVVALLGVMLARGRGRALLIGLWTGYLAYGLSFTYHIHTHDYYSLQLVPIVALSLTPVVSLVFERLRRRSAIPLAAGAATVLVVVGAVALDFEQIRERLTNEPQTEQSIAVFEEIGDEVNHSLNTVYVDRDYGAALRYYGYFSGSYWPTRGDILAEQTIGTAPVSAEQRLRRDYLPSGRAGPEYFIVTKLDELELQPDLRRLLAHYPVTKKTPDYVIYDMRPGPGGA
jgi:hypothetical protein